ncbi:hypothetical protein MXE00_15990, partial [Legionella pneumophila]|nr:hypothetical protein [Legionella pneumophila]
SPLAQYSDETVQFLPLRGSLNSRFIRVNSVIVRSAGQNIPNDERTLWKGGHGDLKYAANLGIYQRILLYTQILQVQSHLL